MVLRIVLGAVYTAMAVGQLASFGHMPGILAAYGLVDGAAATALAVALIAGELVCGVWFLARPRSKTLAPVWVYTAVAVMWSLLAVQAYARGLTVTNCGCFGLYLSQRLSWFVLTQDALTLLYAGLLLHGARKAPAAPAQRAVPSRGTEQDETAAPVQSPPGIEEADPDARIR
ncbi:MauE/DoxX family redox-associated membrane protein [Streptomyces sp. ISL-100]|uniref:MauE/DoxX family redox-associated membrane protein n=1 Tax=Streptomyces sp. ISL-100 TaxID=2819173 RepID=UPI0020362311|nr:MauE/DoxX family redox-associated membrane protein [Streptomyces sp. ISL-100]